MAERKNQPVADARLDTLLEAWGKAYGSEYRDQVRRWRETAHHPIARGMEFAPGRKVSRSTKIIGRGGEERRRLMARNVGLKGLTIVPADYVDAVRCKESPRSPGNSGDRPAPPELQRVEKAVKDLELFSLLRGFVVRVQFAVDGDQRDKASRVNELMRSRVNEKFDGISVSRYRDELAYARTFLHGALVDLLARAS